MKLIKHFILKNYELLFVIGERLILLKVLRFLYRKFYLLPRNSLSLQEIEQLSKKIGYSAFYILTPEIHKSNDWYGHATILKEYSHLPFNYQLKAVLEHGLFFGNYIWNQDIHNQFPLVLTLGIKRIQYLQKKTNKQIISIGPYIHYSKSFLSEECIEKERERLGKNLLVFPCHSSGDDKVTFDFNDYCNEIIKIGRNFQSIRICIYWKDVQYGILEKYKKYPFELVTAGHMFDPMFIPRIKSLISTSSVTASNSVGTHIGYSVYMNKPHYLLKQKLKYSGNLLEVKRCLDIEKTDDYLNIENAFLDYHETISENQRKIVNMYWGLDQIKTYKELRAIFESAERLYRNKS